MPTGTFERIRSIVVDRLGVAPRRVTPATSFVDDLDVDRLEKIELIMNFEDEFDVMISDLVAKTVVTVGDAVNIIEGRKNRRPVLWPGYWGVSA